MINNPRKVQVQVQVQNPRLAHCSSGRCKSHVTARHLTFVRRGKARQIRDEATLKSSQVVPRSCANANTYYKPSQVKPSQLTKQRSFPAWYGAHGTLCLRGHFLSHVNHNLVELCLPCSCCCCCCSCSCCCCFRCLRGTGVGKTLLLCGFCTSFFYFLMHLHGVSSFCCQVSRALQKTPAQLTEIN